ncbi:lysophospholipase L1-like esterase [Paenibacillus sp. W4I10]|uniref:SGNH/GDSL hydrolase family protein n=1 Tax=Paenibacillus sp. W4I10 TaxID=3042298 RepID=UPI002786E748|nr:SGNH/GDSL hydrolase family protein [Paenibacillus sp. W4I10]MDQ0721299.1 lysophospholipase L1-like esterase [Paenibacillus sp. W4I10]
MKLQKNDKLLFIGDSITDCGREHPVGEGSSGLGHGYVAQVYALLRSIYPELMLRVQNVGNGGNTIRDLKQRWDRDVLDLKPDWLTIMIGINDVWRQFDNPLSTDSHVFLEEYESTLRELVASVRPNLKGLVLMTPYYLEANPEDPMRATMDIYGEAVRRVASEYDAVYVDTEAAFAPFWDHFYTSVLTYDRVHPDATGHMVLSKAFLDAIGFEWSGGVKSE